MPPNQTKTEGNDDQSTWGLASLTAAERSFPERNGAPYLTLATNVFDDQVARWDTATCNGGLRWQIFSFNNGYNYKNSLANGQLLELAARLAQFTGNTTYQDWVEKIYTWSEQSGLLTAQGEVYDGADVTINCSDVNHIQWTSSASSYLYGSAVMFNLVSRLVSLNDTCSISS
jgi:mannan endo-1,6-alpha-mannosidase